MRSKKNSQGSVRSKKEGLNTVRSKTLSQGRMSSLKEDTIQDSAPRLRTQGTDDNVLQVETARSSKSVDRQEEIRALVKSINSKEMNLLLQSVRDEIQFRVKNEMERAQKQLSDNQSMRSSKQRSAKGEFILE